MDTNNHNHGKQGMKIKIHERKSHRLHLHYVCNLFSHIVESFKCLELQSHLLYDR